MKHFTLPTNPHRLTTNSKPKVWAGINMIGIDIQVIQFPDEENGDDSQNIILK
jgi:hypothetical protein